VDRVEHRGVEWSDDLGQLWTPVVEETSVLCERYNTDLATVMGTAPPGEAWLRGYR
jgi:hypothetical protein